MKQPKKFIITTIWLLNSRKISETEPLTLNEAIQYFKYTLDVGESYQNEKGNKKINTNPKSMKVLITNLYNAKNNAAKNGYAGCTFTFREAPVKFENQKFDEIGN